MNVVFVKMVRHGRRSHLTCLNPGADPEKVKYLRHLVKRLNLAATVVPEDAYSIDEIINSLEFDELVRNAVVLHAIANMGDEDEDTTW